MSRGVGSQGDIKHYFHIVFAYECNFETHTQSGQSTTLDHMTTCGLPIVQMINLPIRTRVENRHAAPLWTELTLFLRNKLNYMFFRARKQLVNPACSRGVQKRCTTQIHIPNLFQILFHTLQKRLHFHAENIEPNLIKKIHSRHAWTEITQTENVF